MNGYKASDRRTEEEFFTFCQEIVQENIDKYQKQSIQLGIDIKALFDHYHSDNPELHNALAMSIDMKAQVDNSLAKNEKALEKLYFGRVDYMDKEDGRKYTLYIGKNGVVKDGLEPLIIDWRAPVSSIYYENQVGEGSYQVPEQAKRQVTLDRKRTYEIVQRKLLDFYDAEVIANDELLTKYLGKNKEAVLGEIIATIQKEQNDIIRQTPYRNMVVQGVAGSGKTTVAMHRISYILYNYGDRFKPQEFFVIGSNKMLLNYITGVLPDLDVRGINQMVMEDFFIWLLDKDYKEKSYKVLRKEPGEEEQILGQFQHLKGSLGWLDCLKKYLDRLEKRKIQVESVICWDEVVYSKEAIQAFLDNNSRFSLRNKMDMLNKRVMIKVKDYLRMMSAESHVVRAESKKYKNYFGNCVWKTSVLEHYIEFVEELAEEKKEYQKELQALAMKLLKKELDVYDLAAMVYLKHRIKDIEDNDMVKHIVIDEAQDFGSFVFKVMKEVLPKATYTIMGDVSQNINYSSGMNDWEVIKNQIFSPERDSFYVLAKSYRNTIEISEFAQIILRHGSFANYPIEPIIRHGKKPEILCDIAEGKLLECCVRTIEEWQKEGYETIAVICRDKAESAKVRGMLSKQVVVEQTEAEDAVFSTGVMVLPVALTKGLEFDTVFLWDPTKMKYPCNDANVKLLYVAATRALHQLVVAAEGELSEILME